jgi:hypothetical protein
MSVAPDELDEARIERIWRRGVLPYLQEQLLDQPQRLAGFLFEVLRQEA